MWTGLYAWFLGPPESAHKCISIGSAVFVVLTKVTSRETDRHVTHRDRSRSSFCSNRPHLAIAAMPPKAPSTPATMSKQRCRMLQVERCVDIVTVFGNNVERNLVLSTKSLQIVSTLSKRRHFVRHCCQNRQHCRSYIAEVMTKSRVYCFWHTLIKKTHSFSRHKTANISVILYGSIVRLK